MEEWEFMNMLAREIAEAMLPRIDDASSAVSRRIVARWVEEAMRELGVEARVAHVDDTLDSGTFEVELEDGGGGVVGRVILKVGDDVEAEVTGELAGDVSNEGLAGALRRVAWRILVWLLSPPEP